MWKLDYKESWVLKNWCFWTVVLEKTLESPLDCKEIQPLHPKGDQSWVFIERIDAEAETPILGSPDAKNWLIGKGPGAGKDWGQEEKGTTEDEMVGWHHRLNRYRFGWTPGVCDGQESLACCYSWGHKESDMTEQLNWTEHKARQRGDHEIRPRDVSGHCSWISVTAASEWHCILLPPLLDSWFHSCHPPNILDITCTLCFNFQHAKLECQLPKTKIQAWPDARERMLWTLQLSSQEPSQMLSSQEKQKFTMYVSVVWLSFPSFGIYIFFPFAF